MAFKMLRSATTTLSEGTWRVSSDNIFVQEYQSKKIYIGSTPQTRPNWPLIIPLAIVLIAAIIALSVFLYRRWRKTHCVPVSFAGSVLYVRIGSTFRHANAMSEIMGEDWLTRRLNGLKAQGMCVNGIFTDPNLTKPFDQRKPISAPVHLYPKITK